MTTIRLLDARRGLNRKCEELFKDAKIAESIYRYLCDGIEECEDVNVPERNVGRWIPVTERLPIKEFEDGRKNRTVYDIYPCLVTRYSTHTDEPRTRTYVCKSYFDGEDFMLHGGYDQNEESDTENTLAWMPLPEPYRKETEDGNS